MSILKYAFLEINSLGIDAVSLILIGHIQNGTVASADYRRNYTYSIVFDGNGKNSGVMKSITKLKTGDTVTLPKNTFTKKGCNFLGWSKAKNSSADDDLISDADTVINLNGNLKNNVSVKLYAKWEPITYTITFDPDSTRLLILRKKYLK